MQFGGDFEIFPRNDLVSGVKNGHPAAVATEHLPEFQADVTASENEEVFGKSGELQDGFAREIRDTIEAGDRRNTRAATGVDEDLFALKQVIRNPELMRANKSCVPPMEAKVGTLIDLFLLSTSEVQDDLVFLGNDFGEIGGDVRGRDPPTRGVPRVVGDLRAMHHDLGGRAAHVDAGAAQIFFLDECH